MIKKIFLPTIFLLLTYGFWISPDFKVITAGVAIFLFGMLALEQGFNAFAGGTLERTLRKSTNKMWKSLTFGFTAATVMQSSSLVSVIKIPERVWLHSGRAWFSFPRHSLHERGFRDLSESN